MQLFRRLLSTFGGGSVEQQHTTFLNTLLSGNLSQDALQQQVTNYISKLDSPASLLPVVNQFLGKAKADGDQDQLDLLNNILSMLK